MDYKLEYNKLRGEVYRLNKHIEELENSSFVETLIDKYESKISRLTNKLNVSNKNVSKYKEKYIKANKELISLRQSLIDKDNEINDLNAKIVKLEAQLHKDASNSSIPSSKDDNHKIIPNSRVRTGLKPGGQLGHIGHSRRQYVPDIVKELEPDDYIVNDTNFVKTSKKISKQVVDISLNVKVTEYIAYIYKNKINGSLYHPSFPNNINNEVNYGPSVKALAYMLNNYCNVSIDKTIEIIKQLSNDKLVLSKGFINNLNRQFSNLSRKELDELFNSLSKANILFTDNTNARVNGKSRFAFVCADDNSILYTYAPHKGYKGIDLTPVKDNTGILIHDHDKSFYAYGSKHQECVSHILRYLQSSIDNEPNITWSKDMKSLLQLMIHTVKHDKLTNELIDDYKSKYDYIIDIGENECIKHPPSKYYKDGINLLKRLKEYKASTLYFLDNPLVTYNNNLSERLLREVKRKTKQVTSFRSDNNLSYYLDGLSIIKTAKANDINIYQKLVDVFESC